MRGQAGEQKTSIQGTVREAVWLMSARLGSGHRESDTTERVNNKMQRAQYCQNLKVPDYHARGTVLKVLWEVRSEKTNALYTYFIS